MTITKEEVENVADLARLSLTEEEKEIFPSQLSDILSHIDKLNNLSTDDVKIAAGAGTPLREDKLRTPFFKGDLMKNAPEQDKGYFKVPKIIE